MITVLWLGSLAALCFLPPGVLMQKNGGTLDCLYNEATNKVTIQLRIEHSLYPSECPTTTDGKPIFQSSPDGTLPFPKTECPVTSDIRSSACDFNVTGSDSCGCTGNDTSYFYVDYQFERSSGINQWYTATIQCTHPTLLTQQITFPTCQLPPEPTPPTTPPTPPPTTPETTPETTVLHGTPTTSSLAQSTSETSEALPKKKTCKLCDCGCGDGCALCVVVIILIIVIVCLVVAFFVVYCFCRHRKRSDCCCGLEKMFDCMDSCTGQPPPSGGGCSQTGAGSKDAPQNGANNGTIEDPGQPLTTFGANSTSADSSRPS